MRKILLLSIFMLFGTPVFASDVGFGITEGSSRIPRSTFRAFLDSKSTPPVSGEFLELSFVMFDKKHNPSWIFSLGHGVFEWGNIPALKSSEFDVSGSGSITAVSVEKQVNVYNGPFWNAHFRSGIGGGKLVTTLDSASLAMLLRSKTQSGYVPMPRMSGGIGFHPNPSITFGVDAGWGYLWEEYKFSVMCRF